MTKDPKKALIIVAGIIAGISIHHIYDHFSRMRLATAPNSLLNDLRQTNADSSLTVNTNTTPPKTP